MHLSQLWKQSLAAACVALAAVQALAADWSDTSINYRYGTKFREPFVNQGPTNSDPLDIQKDIIGLVHASGYKYGSNFFSVDLLMSDKNDPAACPNFQCTGKAQEVYIVYRTTLDIGKIMGKELRFGPTRGFGITTGFDANAKTDAGYSSKKRMFVLGPTLFVDVPGFLNVSVLQLWESNAPCTTFPPAAVGYPASGCVARYSYKPHPMLTAAWGIPLGGSGFSYEGFFNYIASKGQNEFGGGTRPETLFDSQIMFDLARVGLAPKGTFKVGIEYQYWRNKFGTDHKGPAGPGAFAKTPMFRAEYHF